LRNPALKKTATILDNIFTLAAVFYLLATLFEHANKINIELSSVLLPVVVLFCITHLFQASIIQILLSRKLSWTSLLRINSAAQLYKYVPGNVAHFFMRWLNLKKSGVGIRDNARLIVYETLLLVITYTLFGLVFFTTTGWLHTLLSMNGFKAAAVVSIVCVLAGAWVLRKKIAPLLHANFVYVIFLYSLSALIFGLILCVLNAYMVPEITGIGFCTYTLGFAVSYLAGFVVPGSPGGIGIREVVFIEIFRHSGNELYLLTQLIVLFRLTGIAAEICMYCLTNILLKHKL
jgi:hypothetical protein